MMERVSTRRAFGEALLEIGRNERLFVLDSDVSKSTYTYAFSRAYPERFLNVGIAECNMIGVAAGIAACGNIAFACSFAMFAVMRACEQIRNSVCCPNLDVKIVGTHSGLSAGMDGASHHALEDAGLLRSFPNMTVICPADAVETKRAVRAAAARAGPVYIRLRRTDEPVLYGEGDAGFTLGKANTLRTGSDVALIASGSAVHIALAASETLASRGVRARVIDMHTIKPLDEEVVVRAARECGAVVSCEEHSASCGLGSAVAEVLSQNHPVPVRIVGTGDVVTRSGEWGELQSMYGIGEKAIVEKALQALEMKRGRMGRRRPARKDVPA